MKYIPLCLLLMVAFACNGDRPQIPAAEEKIVLEELLHEFLRGASVNDAEIHDNFWADDLIYTSSAGERFGKSTIMEGLEDTDPETDPHMRYDYEDLEIRVYDNTAVIAFRLVGEALNEQGEVTGRMEFLNSGTFRKRGDRWQAVNWQATRVPE